MSVTPQATIQQDVLFLHTQGDALLLDVLVTPKSSRNRIMGIHNNRVKIQLTAPPKDNQANIALVYFLSDLFKISKVHISIVGGHTSRRKTVHLRHVTSPQILLHLGGFLV